MDEFDDYFLWLCGIVDADMTRYSELMWLMHDTDFVWCNVLDESRAVEGLELREQWYRENPYEDWIMFLEKNASVLEVLIGLARRMEDATSDINTGDRTRVWFGAMVRNLHLETCTNDCLIDNPEQQAYVQMVLSRWMNREFDIDGNGSPFPLLSPTRNQRDLSLVYQMYDWFSENFFDV